MLYSKYSMYVQYLAYRKKDEPIIPIFLISGWTVAPVSSDNLNPNLLDVKIIYMFEVQVIFYQEPRVAWAKYSCTSA